MSAPPVYTGGGPSPRSPVKVSSPKSPGPPVGRGGGKMFKRSLRSATSAWFLLQPSYSPLLRQSPPPAKHVPVHPSMNEQTSSSTLSSHTGQGVPAVPSLSLPPRPTRTAIEDAPLPALRPLSMKISPRALMALGGLMVAAYPAAWRSQGGLASELALFLDQVRENSSVKPSTHRVDDLVQRYDLGTELSRFHLRLEELYNGVDAKFPRDLMRGQFDALSESAWWLLQAYSREELRCVTDNTTKAPATRLLSMSRKSGVDVEHSDSGDEEEAGLGAPSPSSSVPSAEGNVDENESTSVAALAKLKQRYVVSTNVLASLEEQMMAHVGRMRSSLAVTVDSARWEAMVGTSAKSQQLLLRELELGANDPTTRDLGTRLFQAVENCFDQYTGLRQIADFRGLPDVPFQLTDAVQLISRIHEHTLATGLQTLENLELVDEMRLAEAFDGMCECLLREYRAFKAGQLTRLGYMSSLHETEGGRSLNSTVVLDYIRQVMGVCDETVEEMTSQFNERIQQIELLSAAKQAEVFSAMGGRQELGQRVRAHLFQVKPWARESIQLQTESLLQREVFGKSRADIMATLVASKDQMLQGFKSLTENRIPEPLNRLDEIISHLDQQIEQLLGPLSARNKTRFGKTKMTASKVSSRGRKGKAQGEGSVAFSGTTIRGNKFTEADLEEFNSDKKA